MSLDMDGGVSSLDGRAASPEALEEDYCLNAAQRFRQHWMQHGTFQPAALRHYGVRGDVTLMRSLMQSRTFSATFGTFSLGDLRDFEPPPPQQQQQQQQQPHIDPNAPPQQHMSSADRGINGDYDVPMGAVLLGPNANPQRRQMLSPEELKSLQDELNRSWVTLSQPSEWCQAMAGVLTITSWVTVEQRERARHQLQLAAFMGVKAVQVPLPMLLAGRWQSALDDEDWHGGGGGGGGAQDTEALSAQVYAERNWQLLAEVAETLASFVRDSDAAPKVWVRCDVCYPLQRRQFHALRSLVLYGAERDAATGKVVGARSVNTSTACERIRREGIHALMPLLYFSNPYALPTFSTEWLGEDVAVFEVPPADLMLRSLRPADATALEENANEDEMNYSTTDYDYGIPSFGQGEGTTNGGVAHLPADASYSALMQNDNNKEEEEEEEVDLYSLPGLRTSAQSLGDTAAANDESMPSSGLRGHETPNESPLKDPARRRAGPKPNRHVWQLPPDLLPRTNGRWGGHYPTARLSLVAFVVELMRRRACPLFSQFFFDHYTIVNFLHFVAVADHARDNFVGYEDVLQLPLQPLGHQLSSGVYEVFERDAGKYRQYREAFYAYTLDWVNAEGTTHHHGTRCHAFAQHHSPCAPTDDKLTMYVVLLGSGRGPLIDEIFSAASSLGVRVRLFALEKNAPAAAFTALRWRCDPEWQHLSEAFGHSLSIIVADARAVFDQRGELALPSDFGLCDVVVSELLGSFGDNELSPECIEGFVAQLKLLQAEKVSMGLSFNDKMACIPESYTAWAAPVHSVRLEQALADAAIRGLTVQPADCEDRHAALFHSMFVCNLTRGIALAAPQPCWTFHHSWAGAGTNAAPAKKEKPKGKKTAAAAAPVAALVQKNDASYRFDRHVRLRFEVPPQGRCSGFQGFFSCVLYTPRTPQGEGVVHSPVTVKEGRASKAITMSTVPVVSSRALVDGRTEDMYSWFPCFFPLDPANVRDIPLSENHLATAVTGSAAVEGQVQSKSATTTVHFEVSRHVDSVRRKMWYSWRVDYDDSGVSPAANSSAKDAVERRTVVSNEDGWASTVLL